jgi:hypothetical protein
MSRYEAIVAVCGIIFGTASLVGVSLAIAWGMRSKKGVVSDGGAMARVDQRLERMEQAIDAMAVEMERVSEGQRFTTRLISEQAGERLKA